MINIDDVTLVTIFIKLSIIETIVIMVDNNFVTTTKLCNLSTQIILNELSRNTIDK